MRIAAAAEQATARGRPQKARDLSIDATAQGDVRGHPHRAFTRVRVFVGCAEEHVGADADLERAAVFAEEPHAPTETKIAELGTVRRREHHSVDRR